MNDQDNEALLAIYRRSRDEQPSEILDKRIRKVAVNQIRRKKYAWIRPLSTAAVLVLSFSVVLQIWVDQPTIEDSVEMSDMNISPAPSSAEKRRQTAAREETQRSIAKSSPLPKRQIEVQSSSSAGSSTAQPDAAVLEAEPSLAETMDRELADEQQFSLAQMSPMEVAPDDQTLLPILPIIPEAIAGLAPELEVEQAANGTILVYQDNTLVLRIEPLATDVLNIKAWPGAAILGVSFDWSLAPDGLGECSQDNNLLQCVIDERVVGYFENDRLDHIEWSQNSQ